MTSNPRLKTPRAPAQETVLQIQEDEEQVRRKIRRMLPRGRQENILYGFEKILKEKLGQ